MIPTELCHYTKKDIALEKIFYEGKIKFNQLGRTNDPKESVVYPTVTYFPSLGDKNADEYYKLLVNEFQRIQKEEWKVLCMTMHSPKKKNQNKEASTFRYGWNRPVMWAHYAENNSGVCIIFDGNKLYTSIKSDLRQYKLISKKVCYEKPSTQIKYYDDFQKVIKEQPKIADLRAQIRKHLEEKHAEYFFSKFSTWRDETEYRFLVHNISNQDEFVNIHGAIKSILVGSNFPKVYIPSIEKIAMELNISAGKMLWTNGIPTPQFGSIYNPKKLKATK
ncbi:MAG: DUF2971 domain-containing protein [Anaerolineales bacterium]|nr:DUF2971 domain-containing protein [Anaerolineales bacterium]